MCNKNAYRSDRVVPLPMAHRTGPLRSFNLYQWTLAPHLSWLDPKASSCFESWLAESVLLFYPI